MPTAHKRMLLSVHETAEVMGVSRPKIYDLINEGRLRTIKIGRRTMIPIAAIEDFIAAAAG